MCFCLLDIFPTICTANGDNALIVSSHQREGASICLLPFLTQYGGLGFTEQVMVLNVIEQWHWCLWIRQNLHRCSHYVQKLHLTRTQNSNPSSGDDRLDNKGKARKWSGAQTGATDDRSMTTKKEGTNMAGGRDLLWSYKRNNESWFSPSRLN